MIEGAQNPHENRITRRPIVQDVLLREKAIAHQEVKAYQIVLTIRPKPSVTRDLRDDDEFHEKADAWDYP